MNLKKIVIFSIAILVVFVSGAVFVYHYSNIFLRNMPTIAKAKLAKEGGVYVISKDINPFIKEAAIASQDRRFYKNSGVDLQANIRAIYFSAANGQRQGASTITEQLIKNVYFEGVDDLNTDILTKVLAVTATKMYSKDTILELYLNSIYYGKQNYGIEKASEYYFQRPAESVTLEEAAYLMALINAPSYLSVHKSEADNIARIICQSMYQEKYITQYQLNNDCHL